MYERRSKVIMLQFLVLFSAASSAACIQDSNRSLNETPLWQGKKDLFIRELLIVGGDDLAAPDSVIGGINDIAFDHEDSIYVLDFVNYRVSKFSSEGRFLAHYGKGKGQGPGELQYPTGVCVDLRGNVYIADFRQRLIHVYDQSNAEIGVIRTKDNIRPIFGMTISTEMELFAGVDLAFSRWDGGLFQVFSLPSGKYIGSLAGSDWFKGNRNVMSGNNCIALDESQGQIIVSHANPYKIDVFSKKRELISSYRMKNEALGSYILDGNNNRIMEGTTINLAYLPCGMIINAVRYLRKTPEGMATSRQFDFINIKNGEYLLSVNGDVFGIHGAYTLVFKADSHGDLWISYNDPYPHIKKISLEIIDK